MDELTREKFKEHEKTLSDHETRIDELEKSTRVLETMNYRMGNIEKSVEKIDSKLDSTNDEKGKKWDKLVDYLFYAILGILLSYIAYQMGLK